jgi:acetyl esterase
MVPERPDPAVVELIDGLDADAPGLETLPLHDLRDAIEEMSQWQGAVVDVEHVEDATVAGPQAEVPVRIYRPPDPDPKPVVVFAPGGGWVGGSLELADRPARLFALAAGAIVVNVGYRRAPEHRYPAPVHDFCTVLEWAASQAPFESEFLAVAGDSSGGTIAATAALIARDRRFPGLAHQLLIYPALARRFTSRSYEAFGDGRFLLTRSAMEYFWAEYLGEDHDSRSGYAEPLTVDGLSGLPPTTVLVCGLDPLYSDGEEYAERLAAAGVPVTFTRFSDLVHPAFWMAGVTPRAAAFIATAGQAVRNAYAPRRVSSASDSAV